MRKLLVLSLCLLTMAAATAQSDYEATFTKLSKAYVKSPDDVETLYNLALFYADKSNPVRNLPMAMKYIERTEACHIKLIETDKTRLLSRLVHRGITLPVIRQTRQSIADEAYKVIAGRTDMTADEIDVYLDAFSHHTDIVRLLRQQRIQQVYGQDLKQGTVESYYHFIKNYPGTQEAELMEARLAKLAPGLFETIEASDSAVAAVAAQYPLSPSVQRMAEKQKSRHAYAIASKQNSVKAYQDFLKKYPTSDQSQQARDNMDSLIAVSYAKCKSAVDFGRFAAAYPDMSLADKALDQMCALIEQNHDVEAARYYLDHFKLHSRYPHLLECFYAWHAAEGNSNPIQRFIEQYPDFPYQRTVEEDLELAARIERIDLMVDFQETDFPRYADHVRQFTGKGIAFVPLQRMLQPLLASRNYHAALDRIDKFDICFDSISSSTQYQELVSLLSAPPTGRRLKREFASPDYHILNPTLNPADGRLYFTRVMDHARTICYAVRENGQWHPRGEVFFQDAPLSDGYTIFQFCDGGSRMLLGYRGDIMIASNDNGTWRITDIPPYPVNTDYIETDAYMLPDGSGILLASDRPGGCNLQASGVYFHGDTALATDIYFIPYSNNAWGTPVHLPRAVNTPYSERFPILSRNLKTLYFISDGHGGLGYGDIYSCSRTNTHEWTSWTTPVNLGKEANTGFSETSISFSPDEKQLLVSSNHAQGIYACYSVPTSHDEGNHYRSHVVDIQGLESSVLRIRVADLAQQTVVQTVECNGQEHSVTISLHNDASYAVLGEAGSRFVPAMVLPSVTSRPASAISHLRAYTMTELIAMDKPVPIPTVDFDTATGKLTPIAEIQLAQLARFLATDASAIVEFSIDVAGSDATRCYNQSLERGRLIRNYLNCQGIDNPRIIISAYGNVNAGRQGTSAVAVRFRE